MNRARRSKLLALVMAAVMLLSLLPISAFAEELTDEGSTAGTTAGITAEQTGKEPAAPQEGEQDKVEPAAPQEGEQDKDEPAAPQEGEQQEKDASPADGAEGDPAESAPEPITTYKDFIDSLTTLEAYASAFVREHPEEEAVALVINYIRCGVEKYTSGTWTTFCGSEKTAFTSYVAEQDTANSTSAGRLRSLGEFTLPNGNTVEFAHMFGAMDMSYHTKIQSTADLGSWAGDICDLVQLTTNGGVTGTVEEMAEEIRTKNDEYFLHDVPDVHSFGILDLYGDLDAFYILKKLDGSTTISAIMKSYYTQNLTDEIRVKFFLENRFNGVSTKEDIRAAIYDTYLGNEGIHTLERSYLPDGVDPDLRQACCYAFADYLFLTAGAQMTNPYYQVFSSKTSMLAPGVTQEIRMAQTQDDRQIVYYIATADVSRDDVDVYANYGDNDGSQIKMVRVTDQMKAAEKNHCDPTDPRYIPNYSAVVGINGDFYNMSNGWPSGALVMEGVEYSGVGSENFFGILKNGTPIIGGKEEWDAHKGEIKEAIGTNIWLVKDGKIVVTNTSNYYTQRAPRSCVGITYDGRVVLMALDGRQDPFSAGGSNIEIAQIMLDAGCVSAVNLDGGGSTTFATKAEGSNTITVTNRPSDGYERSVSSSLMVVSTAKPSNVFDHAVIAADYDYLTVGTKLEMRVSGVTATGGAIALPEGATLTVSDEGIGTMQDNVFTAAGLGDVQIRLVDADGGVLGTKTLHVVEATELRFTRDTVNMIYGEPTELPLEASYNGNLVKINPADVTFGYLKITLTSIGEMEGGQVNTTKTELVFDYPEAGSASGFAFTPNAEGKLRTLTIGAVLTNKIPEFQQTIDEEFRKAYQAAKANGASNEEAAIQAQTIAINKALELAAKTTAYFYRNDEADFDFNHATGGSGLLAWNRSASNANYKVEDTTYYLIDSNAGTEISYTFAVDMSKVAIPEKLTKLLYMLPGGDQEGRTAWDFLLQLAERISPLTTVTITLTAPEGVTIDKTGLRLANEYFRLTSAEVENNKLTVVCNFIRQNEAINPATANPLCVLSGLKLIPTDTAAWDEDGKLTCSVSGDLSYDIYAHFHVLKSMAQKEDFQQQYGLYPYDNSANLPGDYGAHFFSTITDFTDTFSLKQNSKDGWIKEDGCWRYYRNGAALTGVQKLPSYTAGEAGEFWYDLGTDGIADEKLTGLFEKDGKHYFARFGTLASGWQSIVAEDGESYFYYFDPTTFIMYTGVQTIKGLTYTFNEQGQLVRGAFRTTEEGTKYFVAGESVFRRFVTLEEGTYWLDVKGYVAYGNAPTVTDNVMDITWYHFDEKTGLLTGLCNGFLDYRGEKYWCNENGKVYYGLINVDDGIIFTGTWGLVYTSRSCYVDKDTNQYGCELEPGRYWCDANGYILKDGFADIDGSTYYFTDYVHAKGFTKIGDDYYMFNAGNGKMYKDATMWVGANDYGVEPGMHYFDADGKMFVPDTVNGKREIVSENGKLYFTIDGVKMVNGLYELDGDYYFAQNNGELAVNKSVYAETTLLSGNGWYGFGADGKFVKTGFVTGGGKTFYYADGVRAKGLTKIGEDYFFFNAGSGMMYKDATMWVPANDYGVEPGMHYFDVDGKMFVPNLETGVRKIVAENGNLYFTIDGVKMVNGLYELDGAYYFARYDGTLVTNSSAYVETTLLSGNGWYGFGADGKLIKTGFISGGDGNYYYTNGVRAKGFTKIGGDYYLFNAGSGMMYKDATMWVGANNYGVEPGMHYFDKEGKMFVPNLVNGVKKIVNENGELYFTIDGVKMVNGLYELDGAYYFARYDGTLVTSGSAYVETNLFSGRGWYGFGADGKLIKTGFISGGDGNYYYTNGVRAKGFTKIGDDYYLFNAGSGMMYKDATMWVGANNYGVEPGMHHFNADGKMAV